MTDLNERLAALSPQHRAEYERLLAQATAEDTFPISVMQQGLWFLEQLKPHNPAYLIPVAVRLRGSLDATVLSEAVNEIVRRHESLRTTFQLRDGKPGQVVRDRLRLEIPVLDLRDRRIGDEQLDSVITDALDEEFDIGTGPLLRLTLLRLASDEHVLAVAMHHLISDGWSVGIFVAELSELYAAFLDGRPSPLPELGIQYGDFAAWQQDWLADGANVADDLDYWRRHLAGAPPALDLPTDHSRPAIQSFRGDSVPLHLPAELVRSLAELGRGHGATGYMALLAAFQVVLYRFSQQSEVVVGVPTANRGRAETEPLIGFFVNMVPVRTDITDDLSFIDVLALTRDACLGAYAHSGLPFERIVEEIKAPRDLSRSPIFQVSFSYQSDPLPALTLAGLELTRVPLRSRGSRFDLELQAFDVEGTVSGWLEFNCELFEAWSARVLVDCLAATVRAVLADPDAAVAAIDLVGDAAGSVVQGALAEWSEGSLTECFQAIAAGPGADSVAVVCAQAQLSFGELNARANRLARWLRGRGVERGSVVGVWLERGVDLVVCTLAVLKAGGAFLLLDPELPPQRLGFMVADVDARVLLTDATCAAAVAEGLGTAGREVRVARAADATDADSACASGVLVLDVAGSAELWAAESDADLDAVAAADDGAYVVFTSGSSGEPKGVLNTHAGLRNRLLWMQQNFGLDAADRVLHKTPVSFDVCVWELLWPLLAGARLVIAEPGGHRDPGYLTRLIQREEVSTAHFVPSMLAVFLREPSMAACTSLRRVICSGEALTERLRDDFFARSAAQLYNLYGPAEAAIDVTCWQCAPDDAGPVPLGAPIANTTIAILDRRQQPVPVGVPGELCISGVNVGAGYLNRPELDRQKFLPDPDRPGGRRYLTGDLARLHADGNLYYLGRMDRQVKLRGARIELAEIEFALTGHPEIEQAVVLALPHPHGDTRLVAYLTTSGDRQPVAAELQRHLAARLPDYMMPGHYTYLTRIPLTHNGKLDTRALPSPAVSSRPDAGPVYAPPTSDLERIISEAWSRHLGVARIGTEDNFFDLGGHSLLLAEVRQDLAAELDRELGMVELFQFPTVGSLAAHLAAGPDGGDSPAELASIDRARTRRSTDARRHQTAARRAQARNGR